jgi:hypothetical protein
MYILYHCFETGARAKPRHLEEHQGSSLVWLQRWQIPTPTPVSSLGDHVQINLGMCHLQLVNLYGGIAVKN